MEEFVRFNKRLMLVAVVLALISSLVLCLFGLYGWAAGVALGGCISVFNFKLMTRVAARQVFNTESTRSTQFWVVLRFLLMGLALAVGAKHAQVELFGVAAGLLTIQLSIFIDQFSGNRLTLGRRPDKETVS